MQDTAYAKLNLALHVRGRRPDGYHRLETLFVFAEDGDRMRVEPDDALTLDVIGPFAAVIPGDRHNLVIGAAEALRSCCGITAGAALHLDKRLPVAAGIGGGSADAAAALRLLSRLWGVTDEALLLSIARGLGADVPACLESRTVRGEGRGDDLVPIDGSSLAGLPVLIVNPGVPLATAEVFGGWDGIDRGALAGGEALTVAAAGRNDLEAAATALVPEIAAILDALRAADGNILARMSGSGATCFALFAGDAERDAASRALGADFPDWWFLASRLR